LWPVRRMAQNDAASIHPKMSIVYSYYFLSPFLHAPRKWPLLVRSLHLWPRKQAIVLRNVNMTTPLPSLPFSLPLRIVEAPGICPPYTAAAG
jgi:hypothetical protein